MSKSMNIPELIKSGANVQLVVTGADLQEMSLEWGEELLNSKAGEASDDEYLSLDETAKRLNVSKGTLWRWKKMGVLIPAYKIGSKPFYKKSDVTKRGNA